jgi:hypothetical protein
LNALNPTGTKDPNPRNLAPTKATMSKTLDDLYCEFSAVMDQLLHHLALERGHDLSQGMAPDLRDELQEEGAALYERWREDIESKLGSGPINLD